MIIFHLFEMYMFASILYLSNDIYILSLTTAHLDLKNDIKRL